MTDKRTAVTDCGPVAALIEQQDAEIARLRGVVEGLATYGDRYRSEIAQLRSELDAANSQLSAVGKQNERKDAALHRLIADYADVPDPTDWEAQQIFADARAALSIAEENDA